ncbi:hypothetical protein, conserved [Trypanosoma brucei brucei TREU927]|uniref:Uncharacterized protein n=1 Tax=Trypanosoma brucei brucei (strain 927/4 GUTat10.1) TaxID=185431 RepID=Q387U6_TRYB2|nr:hypothetical protein, conserved [Trypanosoma brucei brucei TREU927]EAN78926.1 hypothetical protein, conserved [Trypanosoma brucei brucei TREU927]
MLFLEPEVDYFRMQLHHLAIPTSICIPSVPKTSRNPETRANGDQECETGGENAKVDGTVPFITQEEQNKVIQRALRVALYQRFPYESYDTLENVYILAVTHLALPLIGDTGLSYEDLATLEICEHSLPPELRHRTFPSHLNALIAQRNPPDSGSVIQDRMLDHSATQGSSEEGTGKQRFNDSYFILIPDLTDEQAMVYCKGRQYAGSMLGSGKASVGPASDAARFSRSTLWDDARHSRANALEGPSEDLLSFHVVEGDMIHYVETSQGGLSEPAPRSLRFAAFKVALSQFSFEEQQYYTKKREEVRSHGSTTTLWGSTLHSSEANEVHINKTVRTILASEVPGRWRAEEEEAMKKFFTKCNSVLRAYSTPSSQMDDASKGDGGVLAPKQPGASVSDEHKTRNVAESLGQTERLSHLYGVRRLVYSFAACDCYHLVAEDNNPLYYAKSSRATYKPHTVNVTLISDLTVSPRLTPAFSASPQRCLGARIGTTKTVEGLVVSNQPSRAQSPDIKPCTVGEKFSVGSKRHSQSPGVSPPTSGAHGSDSHAPLQRLPSNTEGYLRLTTSLVCNNVSGNLKHRKENLLEKGLSFGRLNPCHEQATEGNVKCSNEKAVCAGDVVNLFRLLATSSIAQHQLRHNVIRPVISAAVLDSSGNAGTRGALHRHYQRIKCRALLDHTWYSIPIQPVPSTQDEVQWIPIVFGSAECISDVGYRTAVHIGFFPNAEVTDDSVRGNPLRPKGTAFATDVSKQSASPGTATRSAMMPLDTNHATLQTSSSDGSKGLCFSAQLKTAVSSSNEEVPAGVSARRGGVAMSFNTGNEEVPAGVSARRGGVAMSFNKGNEEVPAGVSARRGGVAMSFNKGNEEVPAGVSARRGGVAMSFNKGNEEVPAGVSARRGGVAMSFNTGNEEVPAGVSARRGGVAMSFNTGNEEVPAGVSARRGGVAMSFNTGNEEVPAGVSARRGGVAMSFNTGNEEVPAGVSARRGGVAMSFNTGNEEVPAGVSARRGGVAMSFNTGNEEVPAGVSARRGGVAMSFNTGNEEVPAGVSARRGGVAMSFDTGNLTGVGSGNVACSSEREIVLRRSAMEGGSGWEQRCSSALFSPRPYRPTSLRVWEPGADDQSNSNRFEQGTRVTCAGPPAGFSATSTPWWRLPSQGPRRGDGVNAGRGECSTGGFCNDWQQCDTCGGRFPQGSTSNPRFCEHLQSRPTSVLNTYGKFSRSHSPHPSYNAMQQRQTQHYSTMGRDGRLRPPHTDRWDSNDVNGDVSPRTATDPLRGTFWKSPTLNPSNHRNGADPLLSPLSSPSCSGVLTPNAGRRPTIGEFAATNTRSSAFNCLASFKHHGAATETGNRTASGLENNYHGPSFCKNRAGVPTKRSVVPTFGRMDTLYDNSASGIPIYNEYGYPQGDSRVRPRGMQVMDMMYDRQWQRTQPPARLPVGAGPTNRGSLSTSWTNTTKNGVCGMRRACLPGKPPLASTRPNGASNTLNNGIAPTAVRRLTLRERIQLQRRLQQREANISAFETNIKENYCVGNDVKRFRTDVGDLSSANKTTASNGGERTTTETNSACGARTAAALAAVTFGGDPPSKGSLHSIGKDIMRLKSLTSPFAEADGVNVSFCLRDLTNAFLRMPQSEIKEYDLSKAAWLEDGVSCFVSAKPTKFNGEFENYVRHFNFHQHPFYLRERAFLFVLRVPTQPQLRLIIAVHNMHDFLSVLRQRPLRPLESWRGPHSMEEEMGGLSGRENASQLPADECNSGRTRTFLQRLCKFMKNCISGGNGGGTQQMGWAPITWGQRLALLRIQASAAVHGQAWSECTTPLLTDPVVLYSRMSFLSNRTASFAVLRCQLDTLKAFASTWIKSKRTTADENQVRMIQNRISKVESIQLGCDAPTAGIGEPKTSSSGVQAAGRVQQRLRSLPLRKRMGAPFAWKKADTTSNSVEKKGETQRQPQLKSTISSYSSSASLCRSKPEVGGANSSTPPGGVPASDAAGAATPLADADGTLIRIAERLTSSTDIVSGNNHFPPMRTILKLVTLWEQNAQRQRAFNDCPAEPAPYSYGGSDTVLASNLGARAELRDHQDDYDISVSHIQQLLQWQWEYHQNSYEALSLPVFRGALVASRGCRYGSDACSSVDPKVMGVNPLSRSLLLALVKWGWLVPIDYKALHKRAVRHTAVGDNMLSRVQFGFGVRRRTLFVGVLGFTCYRGWALSLLILYAAYRCFKLAAVGLLSTGAPWPAPLHSGTSIVYSRSEAAVEAMLEERQHFLSQLLATRVLQTQHYVHNFASRLDMLLRGYSPILSLIIGIELLFVWIFFACWSGAARVSATFGVNIDLLHQYMSELISPLPLYDNVMWCLTYMKPNVAGVETFSLVAPLFVVLCLMTQSPLRWVLYKTWEMFLHDDALVRRPVLSF